jgi:hypothetical protein
LNAAFRIVFFLVINYLVKTEQVHIFLFALAIYPSNPRLEQLGVLQTQRPYAAACAVN